MASPADAATAASGPLAPQAIPRGWKRWLLLGFCFGIGYGVTQRLVSIRLTTPWSGHQRFEVKSFPGTELDSLRRRLGDASAEIRGDLDLLELERQQQRDSAAIEERRSEMDERERRKQETGEPPADTAAPDPAATLAPPAEPPSAPALPEPEPVTPTTPAAPPAAAPTTTP